MDTGLIADVVVGRQAIFDAANEVVAYELLYRAWDGTCNVASVGGVRATAHVLVSGVFGLGLDRLSGGRPVFVNVPTQLLLSGDVLDVVPRDVVVEVLEDVPDRDNVRASLQTLRRHGYRMALDDVVADDDRMGLFPLVDVVKIDMMATSAGQRRSLVHDVRRAGAEVLFEKVETPEDAREARQLGVSLLQGYYFARPDLLRGRTVRVLQPSHVRLLAELGRPELNLEAVEALLRGDVYLAERFIVFCNAAAFGWRTRITSVRHALVLLGDASIRRWLSLVILATAAGGKPGELTVVAACRGRFCEIVGRAVGLGTRSFDLVLLGMFSILDAVLDEPMAEAIAGLPLAPDVCDALLGEPGTLRSVLELALAWERGDDTGLETHLRALGVSLQTAQQAYLESLRAGNALVA